MDAGNGKPFVIVDTSFLSDLSRRMLWTFPVVKAYDDAGQPPILVSTGVLGELDRLMNEADEFGIPKASLSLETLLQQAQRAHRQAAAYSSQDLLREIFRVWQQTSRKAQWNSSYSVVDERIMEAAVSHARQGHRIFVASADNDIIATMQHYSNSGLPITVWKPEWFRQDLFKNVSVDLLVMGEVLQELPAFYGSDAYKYYLKVATGVSFGGGFTADVAVGLEKVDFVKTRPQYEGIKLVRIAKGGKPGLESGLRRLRANSGPATGGYIAFFYPEIPGSFRLYEDVSWKVAGLLENIRELVGRERFDAMVNPLASPLKAELEDPDISFEFKARVWARIDPAFIQKFSPNTLPVLEQAKNYVMT